MLLSWGGRQMGRMQMVRQAGINGNWQKGWELQILGGVSTWKTICLTNPVPEGLKKGSRREAAEDQRQHSQNLSERWETEFYWLIQVCRAKPWYLSPQRAGSSSLLARGCRVQLTNLPAGNDRIYESRCKPSWSREKWSHFKTWIHCVSCSKVEKVRLGQLD